jgi:hypothetical protein
VRIARTSRKALAAATSFRVPDGKSISTPPVASRRQELANASTSARCSPLRPPRLLPMNNTTECGPSVIAMLWRSR